MTADTLAANVGNSLSRSRRAARTLAALALALVWLALTGVPASAKMVLRGSIGSGQLQGPVGVAVDQSSHDVYVGTLFFTGVKKFDAAGDLLAGPWFNKSPLNSGVAVNSTNGQVYGVDAAAQEIFTVDPATGSPPPVSSFSVEGSANFSGLTAVQIATDTTGNVYFPSAPNNEVQEFGPSGALLQTFVGSGTTALSAPTGVAVDTLGDVWVSDDGNGRIEEFDPTGAIVLATIAIPGVEDVALDTAGNVFASVRDGSGRHIVEFDSSGTKIDDFGLADLSPSEPYTVDSVAVDNASKLVYVADGGSDNVVRVFGPPVPIATTGQASGVQQTSAIVSGHVDPDAADGGGQITGCQFDYGTSTSYGQHAACSPATPYSTAMDVSAALGQLSPDTTYHFRLEASNANGTGYGADETLTTSGPPTIDEESSSQVRQSTAVLGAQINPFGYDTTCEAQYVDQAQFEGSAYANAITLPCTPSELSAGFGDESASVSLTGLSIATTYHYRFIVTNQAGTTTGPDETFATFGVQSFKMEALDKEGHPYSQAGGHPYQLTTEIALASTSSSIGKQQTDENVKDIRTELPPGLIGNPSVVGKCPASAVPIFQCPGSSQVGILKAYTDAGEFEEPVYNLVPPHGDAAEFGARFSNAVTGYIDFHVRTGGDYGVTADTLNISANAGIFRIVLTVWGVPAESSHDSDRFCPGERRNCSAEMARQPFLTMPPACAGPQTATVRVDSWQHPGDFVSKSATMPGITGCEGPDFTPSFEAKPDTAMTDSPSGLNVALTLPQNENPGGLAEADLKDTTVTLPQGMTVNPSAANGLTACPLLTGRSQQQEEREARHELAGIDLESSQPANCPEGSKIGSVEVQSPLLPDLQTPGIPDVLKGGVYIAQQNNNPFGSLLAVYVTAEDPASGVIVKLAGHIVANPLTGQLTTTFQDNPQLPFSRFELKLSGGPRGSVLTPRACGAYATAGSLTPWTEAETVSLTSPFSVSEGCAPGFAPAFTAGATSAQAKAYSPFVISLSRNDSDQLFSGMRFTLPAGESAKLAHVVLCPDADANASHCPLASAIGSVTACSGGGATPVAIAGTLYLTGPYEGQPYGVAAAVHAAAGPFDLGSVVVRGTIAIDPYTARATVSTDPIPQMVGQTGIPTDVRCVQADVDRQEFMRNPTSCEAMAVNGVITSVAGAQAPVSSRFQVGGCGELPFKPVFKTFTRARHTRRNGAYLHVSVRSTLAQANIAKVRVALPKALPSRLTTLKLACSQAQFAANPSGCPQGSRVGTATAFTPLLSAPLTGPAIFVSHGGAKFPDLDVVLQGNGITIILTGNTFISRGITTSTFPSVPDVPVSRFDLELPAGPHSALSARGNLCAAKLTMPTTITGQNGAVIKQRTKIAVQGCRKHKHANRHRSHRRRHKRG